MSHALVALVSDLLFFLFVPMFFESLVYRWLEFVNTVDQFSMVGTSWISGYTTMHSNLFFLGFVFNPLAQVVRARQ